MRKCMVFVALAITLNAPLAALAQAMRSSQTATFPGKSWEVIAPDTLGAACRQRLAAARDKLATLDTTALLAAQNGKILFSHGPLDRVSILFSARKSILAMLYGKYVASGAINLDRTLADIGIDDKGGLLPIEKQATIRHLLTARSGIFHPAVNGGDDMGAAPPRGSQPPGSYFLYNNWDFNAAGTIFETLTGQGIYTAFDKDFARPLQLEDFDPARHRRNGDMSKSDHAAYHFYLSTRDMARLGLLMLHKGQWRGQQLMPPGWADTITATVTAAADMHPPETAARRLGYGHMWWTFPAEPHSPFSGAALAWGVHGQFILVLPKRNMVIAHKRQVPVDGNWDVSWVHLRDFLGVARILAAAPCP